MPGRYSGGNLYRYSFQGQEGDPEIKGEGNSINYKYRMHDPRLGRFFATDPLESKYPYLTPYQFSSNQPIHASELEGLESSQELNSKDPALKTPEQRKEHQQAVDDINPIIAMAKAIWAGWKAEAEEIIDAYENGGEGLTKHQSAAAVGARHSTRDFPSHFVGSSSPKLKVKKSSANYKSKSGLAKSSTNLYDLAGGIQKQTKTFYHKGNLNNGKVSKGNLSTGVDYNSVSNLQRDGKIYTFDIDGDVFQNWLDKGLVQKMEDYDYTTGTYNTEYRFDASISEELNKYIVK